MDNRTYIFALPINGKMKRYFASDPSCAREQAPVQVDDHHIGCFHQAFANPSWRNQQSSRVETNLKVSRRSGGEPEARQPPAEPNQFAPQRFLCRASHLVQDFAPVHLCSSLAGRVLNDLLVCLTDPARTPFAL